MLIHVVLQEDQKLLAELNGQTAAQKLALSIPTDALNKLKCRLKMLMKIVTARGWRREPHPQSSFHTPVARLGLQEAQEREAKEPRYIFIKLSNYFLFLPGNGR